MRLPAVVTSVVVIGLALPSGRGFSQEKQAKWEYAILSLNSDPIPPEVPGERGKTKTRLDWTTATEHVTAPGWKPLADQLKVRLKDDNPPRQVVQTAVLNHFGSQGWELISETKESGHAYLFKRSK
ncbi:MAG TPA: hypothetical protein VH092_35305 [Urbifossiella sp.]|jgi:hypothetical protein|nr:hypothetical protein [Urbifossiella sp.]